MTALGHNSAATLTTNLEQGLRSIATAVLPATGDIAQPLASARTTPQASVPATPLRPLVAACAFCFVFVVHVSHATHGLRCFCFCFSNPTPGRTCVCCILCFRFSNHPWPQVCLFLFLEPALLVACACSFAFSVFVYQTTHGRRCFCFWFYDISDIWSRLRCNTWVTRPPDRMPFRVYFCPSVNFSALFSRRPVVCWS